MKPANLIAARDKIRSILDAQWDDGQISSKEYENALAFVERASSLLWGGNDGELVRQPINKDRC